MLNGGEDPRYVARRLVRFAAEDVGMADPNALPQALAGWETYERLGSPEGELALGQAVIYLAIAPKSNAGYQAYNEARAFVKQDGSAVFKFAVRKTDEIARRLLERNGLTPDDLDLFVSHQANRRIIEGSAHKLGIDPAKVVITVDRHGNTSAASIPLAICDAEIGRAHV